MNGDEIFGVYPELIVGVAPALTPIEELVTIANQAELVGVLFKLISPTVQ
jgi:hypothetical protein